MRENCVKKTPQKDLPTRQLVECTCPVLVHCRHLYLACSRGHRVLVRIKRTRNVLAIKRNVLISVRRIILFLIKKKKKDRRSETYTLGIFTLMCVILKFTSHVMTMTASLVVR